jgi:hypothetical protein
MTEYTKQEISPRQEPVSAATILSFLSLHFSQISTWLHNFAQRAGRENIVGVCYFDEFLARRIIATRWVSNCLAG